MAYDPQEIPRIRQRWERAGSVPCSEHSVEREYIPGIGKADYYCSVCGLISPDRSDFVVAAPEPPRPLPPSSARPVLDLAADFIEARRGGADDERLNQISHEFFKAVQSLQAVLEDPHR